MDSQLAASYRCVEEVARTRARNFYYSFVLLPEAKRLAFCAVYAFMRFCDDISDGEERDMDKRRALERWRGRLQEIQAGNVDGDLILPAFRDAVERFAIPAQYFEWIIDGAEMDLTTHRYDTFEALYRYCFHVASAVGLVSLQIFGYSDESAKEYAEQCGIAFQLTNILRDIKEDTDMGRVYLPSEDLERFEYTPEDLSRGVFDDRFRRLMMFETARARDFYARASNLLPLVETSSRPALWAMMEIYGRILKRIERSNYNVFDASIHLSPLEKMTVVARALAMKFLRRC
jgi:15-cis-phytoene synthase